MYYYCGYTQFPDIPTYRKVTVETYGLSNGIWSVWCIPQLPIAEDILLDLPKIFDVPNGTSTWGYLGNLLSEVNPSSCIFWGAVLK